jgi:hypothetical protein
MTEGASFWVYCEKYWAPVNIGDGDTHMLVAENETEVY